MPGLDDLEEKGLKKLKKRKSRNNKVSTEKDEKLLQASSTSFLYSITRILNKFVFSFSFIILLIIGVLFAIPYIVYWFSNDQYLYFPGNMGTGKADPHLFINYIFLLPIVFAAILFIICYAANRLIRSKVDQLNNQEEDWATQLPFKIIGYPGVLGKTGNNFYINIKYIHQPPSEQSTRAIFEAMIRYLNSFERLSKDNIDRVDISMQGTYWFHKKFHQLVKKVFIPMHQTHPIESISVSR